MEKLTTEYQDLDMSELKNTFLAMIKNYTYNETLLYSVEGLI